MRRPPIQLLVALATLTAAAAPLPAGDVQLHALGAAETGIKAAMVKWRDAELARQGGKFQSHGWWPWGLRAFDYDNDGDLDLLASHHGRPGSIVLRSAFAQTGKLTFVDATRSLGLDGRDLPGADDRPWIWDFNGDGFLDIAGLSDESKPTSLLNRGGKAFAAIPRFTFRPLAHPKEVTDLNGDGHPDVDGGRKGRWLYDPNSGAFRRDAAPVHAVPPGVPKAILGFIAEMKGKSRSNRFLKEEFWTHALLGYDTLGYSPRPIDLNGDGRGDVVLQAAAAYGGDWFGRYLIRTPDGKLTDATASVGLPQTGAPIAVEDLTGDGLPDVLVAGKDTGGLYVNRGEDGFVRKGGEMSAFLSRRGPYLLRAYRVDLDNDGDWDWVLSNPRLGRAEIHENKGGGEFRRILAARAWDSNPVVVCDIDDDGRMDVVIGGSTERRSTEITLYLNRTAGAGRFARLSPRMPPPNPFAVGAVVEAYRPGDLGQKGARPILAQKARPDGKPVHVGLGGARTFDVRIRFPNGKTIEARNIPAGGRLIATPDKGIARPSGSGKSFDATAAP
jgi:hypothetical protein